MKYFESALSNLGEGDDFDISVHCDVKIFEWLLLYIEFKEKEANPRAKFYEVVDEPKDARRKKPEIRVEDVISILISAEYLRIPTLVEECLLFLKENINQVLLQPLDLSCIQNKLLKRLGLEMMTMEELEEVKDKKDRIMS